MKKIKTSLLVVLLSLSFVQLFAQSEQQQRIRSAYVLAFGRDASSAEVTYWQGRGNLTIAQLLIFHQQYLMQDEATHRAAINRAYQDAMGRNASEAEIAYWKKGNDTYTTLMKNHVQWLQANPLEYEKVIKQSYQYVFNRKPTDAELRYWKGQGTFSYLILVGCHQDYQRRNGGNTVNLRNSSSLVTVSVSANLAREANTAAGLVGNSGGTIVAQGAGNLITNDGGSIVAAGAGNIITNANSN